MDALDATVFLVSQDFGQFCGSAVGNDYFFVGHARY